MMKNVFKKSLVIGIIILFVGASNLTIAVTKQIEHKNKIVEDPKPAFGIQFFLCEFNCTFFGECYINILGSPSAPIVSLITFTSSDTSVSPIAYFYAEGALKSPVHLNLTNPFFIAVVGVIGLNTNLVEGIVNHGGYVESPFTIFLIGNI